MHVRDLLDPLTARRLRLGFLLTVLLACDGRDEKPERDSATDEQNTRPSQAGSGAEDDSSGGATRTEDAGSSTTSGGSARDDAAAGAGTRDAATGSEDAGRDAAIASDSGRPSPDASQGTGRTCGGVGALACGAGQFCNYEAPVGQGCTGQIADAAGVCEQTPEMCTEQYQPVCGCDKRTYSNRCEAHAAGISVAKDGACAVSGISCDRRKLTCRRAEPVCPEGQVAQIVGNCFGECVRIEQCACSEAAACPLEEKYTCHRSAMRCGPYLN